MTNKLFKTMVRNVIRDARDVEKEDYADAYLDIVDVSHKCIEVMDWYNHDLDRNYTITNPDCINLDWLKERLVVTKSVSELDYQIDEDALLGYINQFFPKELLATLNHIVICNDGEKDFEEPRCVVKKYSPVWIDGNDLSRDFKGSALCKLCVRERQRFCV